ncbi:ribonuclease P [Synechococcus sp. WH 8020]|uniref:ribonuclease P protein component n=1 Tax=Synechococcus sp. (strain WH8020) TaxID=32052 RepID=UPI0006526ECA|nr:ribonuclease P protein component [Synechococcus sp. WH 8020]AKN60974.1 ribonuclease P [Synechococcus sp. WH 8020]
MVLPTSMRLRGHRCFDYLYRKGQRFHGTLMTLRKASAMPRLLRSESRPLEDQGQAAVCRCAVVISSKVSKRAVIRNRLRRRLHDHLRQHFEQSFQHANTWVLISLKPGAAISEAPMLEECDRLLQQAGY